MHPKNAFIEHHRMPKDNLCRETTDCCRAYL